MRFAELLDNELTRRQRQNPRYSQRAFAQSLGVHHATISRLIAGMRPAQSSTIRSLGLRLGLAATDIERLIGDEDAAFVIALIRRPGFRPDSRWLATRSGMSIDRVNIALHRLIHQRVLRMATHDHWSVSDDTGAHAE